MRKKKVLMVHNFYQIGGGEHTVFNNEVQLLKKNGHEVIEYTRNNNELKNNKFKLLFIPFTTIWSIKTYLEIKKIIKSEGVDIIHCHNTFPLISPSVYYAGIHSKVPVVQTIHNFRFLCPCGIFYRNGHICEECLKKKFFIPAIKNKCYRNSRIQTLIVILMLQIHRILGTYDKINYIFLTNFNKQKFKSLLNIDGNNIFIKPNFVVSHFNESSKPRIKPVFIFAGRFDENKGIKLLLEHWKTVPKNYELHIYGSGPLEKYVEEQASSMSNINYYGFCPHEQINNDMRNAMGMIFPSLLYEGYPMIIAESMSMSCPVLSTNIGNAADIINDSKCGITFNVNDNSSFLQAIEDIIENNSVYRKNALEYFVNELSESVNYDKLRRIYDKL